MVKDHLFARHFPPLKSSISFTLKWKGTLPHRQIRVVVRGPI